MHYLKKKFLWLLIFSSFLILRHIDRQTLSFSCSEILQSNNKTCRLLIVYHGWYLFSLLYRWFKLLQVSLMFHVSNKLLIKRFLLKFSFSPTDKTWTISISWGTQTLFTACMFLHILQSFHESKKTKQKIIFYFRYTNIMLLLVDHDSVVQI